MKKFLLALLLGLWSCTSSHADSLVTTTCGTLREAYTAGSTRLDTVNTQGQLCISGTISASATFTDYTAGTPGQAVPVSGSYVGFGVNGTFRGATGYNPFGTVYTQNIDLTSVGGTATATGHGTAAGAIRVELPIDGTGLVNAAQSGTWNVVCTSGCSASTPTSVGTPGQAVPVSANYNGVNVNGTIRGVTAYNPFGTVYSQNVDLTSIGGTATATGHGTAAGALRVELPTDGTGLVNVSQSTSPWIVSGTVSAAQTTSPWVVAGTVTSTQGTSPWVVSGSVSPTGAPLVTQGTSPWVVAGTVTSTQGTSPWVVSGSVSPTGAPLVTQGTSPWVVSGTVTAAQTGTWTVNAAQSGAWSALVNPTTAGAWGVGAAASAVPTSASYTGLNVGGTLRGATAANPYGTVYSQSMDIASVGGAATATGHGTAAGALRVELPTDGTGLVNVSQSTSPWVVSGTVTAAQTGTWNVVCTSGCSSSTPTSIGTPGQAVPASAQYNGINVAGNIQSVQGVNPFGTTYAQRVELTSIGGTATATGHGTAAGALRVELPTDGTGLVNVSQSTSPWVVSGTVSAAQTTSPWVVSGAVSADVNRIGGTAIVTGGVAGSQGIGGTVATNVAITANPLNLGAQGVSSENSAVTTARQVQLVADLVGKLIVLPYANPENFVSGVITTAMTATTTTSLIASPGGSLRNYITACTFSNSHATTGTDMILQDGSGGTTIWNIPAAAVYGGAHITFPTPLRQPTTATALFVANVTTGASTKAACSGYKGL